MTNRLKTNLTDFDGCGPDEGDPCWHDGDSREHVKVWADWTRT